jgi:hypothetical protein
MVHGPCEVHLHSSFASFKDSCLAETVMPKKSSKGEKLYEAAQSRPRLLQVVQGCSRIFQAVTGCFIQKHLQTPSDDLEQL